GETARNPTAGPAGSRAGGVTMTRGEPR
ncbi:MAG: hypothetical protein V7643_2847, partial [Mycobacterium sp.]